MPYVLLFLGWLAGLDTVFLIEALIKGVYTSVFLSSLSLYIVLLLFTMIVRFGNKTGCC